MIMKLYQFPMCLPVSHISGYRGWHECKKGVHVSLLLVLCTRKGFWQFTMDGRYSCWFNDAIYLLRLPKISLTGTQLASTNTWSQTESSIYRYKIIVFSDVIPTMITVAMASVYDRGSNCFFQTFFSLLRLCSKSHHHSLIHYSLYKRHSIVYSVVVEQ